MDEYTRLEEIAAPKSVSAYVLGMIRSKINASTPVMIHAEEAAEEEAPEVDNDFPSFINDLARRAGLVGPEDFAQMTDEEIVAVRGFGRATLGAIREHVAYEGEGEVAEDEAESDG